MEIVNALYVSRRKDWNELGSRLELFIPGVKSSPMRYRNGHELSLAEISLTIKFGKLFQMLSVGDHEYAIFMEDDVFLCDNFGEKFRDYMSKTPSDWDAIYFGTCCDLKPENASPDKVAYLRPHPAAKCADSIVMRKSAITQIAKTWFPFYMISDWELGWQHHLHSHNVYWWEPGLAVQGSENGMYRSSLRG
jgi:hypothetical protein